MAYVDATSSLPTLTLPDPLPVLSYWESTEARKIFNPVSKEKDELEAIDNQLDLLSCILEAPKGYLHVVTGIQGDDDELSEYQQWLIHLNQRRERLSWAISMNSKS